MKHPHQGAIEILTGHASKHYTAYLNLTSTTSHDDAKAHYDRYVELNTAAQFLAQNLPSGVLKPSTVTPVFVAPTLPSRFPST
jgi:hypothetical protein